MNEEYTCAICKKTYGKCVSEDEAKTELKKFFGDISVEDCVIICDDCWQKIRPDKHGISLPMRKEDLNEGSNRKED